MKYQVLDSMLLNEVQRQERVIAEQKSEFGGQKDQIRILEDRLSRLEAAIASVATSEGVQ